VSAAPNDIIHYDQRVASLIRGDVTASDPSSKRSVMDEVAADKGLAPVADD
jgi:hypothetical protein